MISKVNADSSARYPDAVKQADDKPHDEKNLAAAGVTDKIELSSDAKNASQKENATEIVETFSVNFWSRGVAESSSPGAEANQEAQASEAANTGAAAGIDITVED